VLEAQLVSLEAQLREANAAVASNDAALVKQSKDALVAKASAVFAMLALIVAVAAPFASDYLNNDDTAAIVEAQRETTAAQCSGFGVGKYVEGVQP